MAGQTPPISSRWVFTVLMEPLACHLTARQSQRASHRHPPRCPRRRYVADVQPHPAAGLTSVEAAERLQRDGPNALPQPPRVPSWRRVFDQLTHFFALMLWVAGVLSLVAGLTALGVAIFAVVVFNALFAFVQEYRSDASVEQLRNLLPRRVTVVRDSVPAELDADDLVIGDLVVLQAGDRVAADMEVAEAHGLLLDTSALTGESVPEATTRGDQASSGTFVVEGEARAVVTAVGGNTRLAEIAAMSRRTARRPSPLAQELHRLVPRNSHDSCGGGRGVLRSVAAHRRTAEPGDHLRHRCDRGAGSRGPATHRHALVGDRRAADGS